MKGKVSKGTIEISICERDLDGKPTKKKRSFSSDEADKVREFWRDNKPVRKINNKKDN